jgi:hypothetical protein
MRRMTVSADAARAGRRKISAIDLTGMLFGESSSAGVSFNLANVMPQW